MKKNTFLISLFSLLPLIIIGQVDFTTESFSVAGDSRALVDMNGDFLDDILAITESNVQIRFQLKDGDGNYTGFSSATDFPISATYDAFWSLAAGDYNRDGFNDLVFGDYNGAHVVRFDPSAAGTPEDPKYKIAATSNSVFTQRTNFADINNDGNLDIFVCDDIEPNEYFMNENGTLTLYEGADPNGIPEGLGVYSSGGNYGSIWVDYDNDRDNDLFIAKCGGSAARKTNQLHRNNGSNSFSEIAESAKLNDTINTWSSAWGDYDNDGDMDCFIGSSQAPYFEEGVQVGGDYHKLLRNDNGVFVDISVTSGVDLSDAYFHENLFIDFDNDGWIDLFVNGDILYNNGDGTFTVDASPGLSFLGGAFGDANNDGFIDMFKDGFVYRNLGNSNNWIKVATIGDESNSNGIGARIEIVTDLGGPNEMTQIRDVRSGEGFRYMGSLNAHFGIGSETSIDRLTVYWPSGNVDVILDPEINQLIEVEEGETLSLEDTLVENLILYPNPTRDVLNLNATYSFNNAIYSVFDMNGRRVMNAKLESDRLDVSSLSTGNYILRIMNNNMIKTQKFIKQ